MIINFKYLGQTGGGSSSGGGMTSGDVQTLIESYNYVNSGQVETQITNKGYVNQDTLDVEIYNAVGEDVAHAGGVQSVLETAGIVVPNSEESDLVINHLPTATSDLTNDSGYITSADTQNFIDAATYEEDAEVISTALNDLNERMDNVNSSVLVSVGELNSEVGIGDIQTKTKQIGTPIYWVSKPASWNPNFTVYELHIESVPTGHTSSNPLFLGEISDTRNEQSVGLYDNIFEISVYLDNDTPMMKIEDSNGSENYTMPDELSAATAVAEFTNDDGTSKTCEIEVTYKDGAYVFDLGDGDYSPDLYLHNAYSGESTTTEFDGVYVKTSDSGFTKIVTETENENAVKSNGSVNYIIKVTQSVYDSMAAAGRLDDNTVYYIVADPASGSTGETTFDAATYCTGDLNGSWDGETCEFSWSDPNEGGSRTEYYDAAMLERKWECEQRGHNWDYDNQVCIDPSCEGDSQCECESRGGAWVEDGESEGSGYCDECGSPGVTTEEAAAYNECNCLRNGGTWIPDPESSEGGECQYPEDEGGEA